MASTVSWRILNEREVVLIFLTVFLRSLAVLSYIPGFLCLIRTTGSSEDWKNPPGDTMEVDAEPDLEQQCEDVVFELCDIRERYPHKCAEELSKALRLTTQINNAPVIIKPSAPLLPLVILDEQRELFQTIVPVTKDTIDHQKALKTDLEAMLKTVKDLKTVVEQVRRTEDCTIDNILKKTDKDQH